MAVTVHELRSKDETGREMRRLATTFAGDLCCFSAIGVPLDRIPLPVFFEAIANIPYKPDTAGVEVVTRPYLLLQSPAAGWDCKKKMIVLAAYLERNRITWRFMAVSRRASGQIHHVIVQAWIDGEWVDLDPTYPGSKLFDAHEWTRAEPLAGDGPGSDQPVLVSLSGDGDPTWAMYLDYQDMIRTVAPESMGDGGITAGGVVAIVTAIVAAVTTLTVTIINAASNRRNREAAERVQAANIKTYTDMQAAATRTATLQAVAAEDLQQKNEVLIKKWVVPGSIALAALLFLGGK